MPIAEGAIMGINAHRYGHADSGSAISDADPQQWVPAGSSTGPSESRAAARLLEMTARDTDQWRADASNQAAAIVTAAHDQSADIVRAAHAEAGRILATARAEATRATGEAHAEAHRVREEAALIRKRHDDDIAHLQELASVHREQLRRHLTDMLDRVDSPSTEVRQ